MFRRNTRHVLAWGPIRASRQMGFVHHYKSGTRPASSACQALPITSSSLIRDRTRLLPSLYHPSFSSARQIHVSSDTRMAAEKNNQQFLLENLFNVKGKGKVSFAAFWILSTTDNHVKLP
jgi:hypothetical protein